MASSTFSGSALYSFLPTAPKDVMRLEIKSIKLLSVMLNWGGAFLIAGVTSNGVYPYVDFKSS